MYAGEYAWAHFPQFVAIKIVGSNEHVFFVEKAKVDALAVRGGRAGSPTVQAMNSFQGRFQHDLAPQFFPAFSIQAEQFARFRFLYDCDDVYSIPDDDRRGVPLALDRCFPNEILR